jgi:CRISPR-associated protein Cas2
VRPPKAFYVITYDVVCDRRRVKIATLLEGYGERVQDSVFEVRLSATQRTRLAKRLERGIDSGEDSVRFYRLCESCVGEIGQAGVGPEVFRIERVRVI